MDSSISQMAMGNKTKKIGKPGQLFLRSSYPIPFQRTNIGPLAVKKRPGFMNDGTCTNPCDPNTMGS